MIKMEDQQISKDIDNPQPEKKFIVDTLNEWGLEMLIEVSKSD